MRLMLGTPGNPRLLVTVDDNFDPARFEFSVINGAWDGMFTNGHITVLKIPAGGDYSDLDITHILTKDQGRLRGNNTWDYQTVFNNFDNPNYVGPEYKKFAVPADWDDDIAF
jgi:hypothetical protein